MHVLRFAGKILGSRAFVDRVKELLALVMIHCKHCGVIRHFLRAGIDEHADSNDFIMCHGGDLVDVGGTDHRMR